MSERGWYCTECGRTTHTLPAGFVTCAGCGHLGLRGYEKRPTRVRCRVDGCEWSGWDDGGVNEDLRGHYRREHPERYVTRPRGLTDPQWRLYQEIAEAGTLYVRSTSRYHRIIEALVRKGVVVCSEPDHSRLCQNGYSLSSPPQQDDTE